MKKLLIAAMLLATSSAFAHEHWNNHGWHHGWNHRDAWVGGVYVAPPAPVYSPPYAPVCHRCGYVHRIERMGPIVHLTIRMDDGRWRGMDYQNGSPFYQGQRVHFQNGLLYPG